MTKKITYKKLINNIVTGDANAILRAIPDNSIHVAITSPPYWNVVDYEIEGQIGQSSYENYINDLLDVWLETERVLIPNGKLCIVTPIMPIKKEVIKSQHTRHLKNINNDIEYSILYSGKSKLQRYSLYIWQKQTSTKMFGSYPYPPNIYEDNTIEFINVFVKPGKPRKISKKIKENSKLSQKEWLNLSMQVWPIYPEDVSRTKGHPAPFPLELPARLISMYTFRRTKKADFDGDIVLDMFVGSGTACVAAKRLERRYIGIDINPYYVRTARKQVGLAPEENINLLINKIKLRRASDKEQIGLFKDAENND